MERKTLHEHVTEMVREKNKLFKTIKKKQVQLKMFTGFLQADEELYKVAKVKYDMTPRDECMQQTILDLQKDVVRLKLKMIRQQSATDNEAWQLKQSIAEEHALRKESNRLFEELQRLHRLTLTKSDLRNKKKRELLKAQLKYSHAKRDLRTQQQQILSSRKQNRNIGLKLIEFDKLVDSIIDGRNNYINLLKVTTQRLAETSEELISMKKKLEILHTTALSKDSQVADVTSRKKGISKDVTSLQEKLDKKEVQTQEYKSLKQVVKLKEKQLLQLQESISASIKCRQEREEQLSEREQEVCACIDKLKEMEALILKRTLMNRSMEEMFRFLRICIREEKRHINMYRKQILCKSSLEEECTLLHMQMTECENQMSYLKSAFAQKAKRSILRKLTGKDPPAVELSEKIKKLEKQLAQLEAQLTDKMLLCKQVTSMCEQMHTNAVNSKGDTLRVAIEVNKSQSGVKDYTRRLMAVVSEHGMWQSMTLRLQQEIEVREMELDSCHLRLKQGLPPSDVIEKEWQRRLRRWRRREADAKMRQQAVWIQLPSGVFTTAKFRPKAYMTHNSFLSSSYGTFAPFQPSRSYIFRPKIRPSCFHLSI